MCCCHLCHTYEPTNHSHLLRPLAGVGVVLYHTGLEAFLLVRQFRPAVFATVLRNHKPGQPAPDRFEGRCTCIGQVQRVVTDALGSCMPAVGLCSAGHWLLPLLPLPAGFTYELCAGLIDKATSITQICKEEIMEEGGWASHITVDVLCLSILCLTVLPSTKTHVDLPLLAVGYDVPLESILPLCSGTHTLCHCHHAPGGGQMVPGRCGPCARGGLLWGD